MLFDFTSLFSLLKRNLLLAGGGSALSFFDDGDDVDRGDVDAGLLFAGRPLASVLDTTFALPGSDFMLTILIFTFSLVISTSKFDRNDDGLVLVPSITLSANRKEERARKHY